jgi:hypothetical protein
MFGPSCSRCALRSAFKTYSAHGWAQNLVVSDTSSSSLGCKKERATDSQIIFPSVLFLLVHPLLRVLFPLLQILLPQWQHPRDQDFCKLLHKVGRDGQGRGAVPVAEHGFDEQESLNDQSCWIQGAQVICDPEARSGISLREIGERRAVYL